MDIDVDQLESEIRMLAEAITAPGEGECLLCYVWRMLDEFGCQGRRWAPNYRDRRAPRATALEQRLARMGACCCDCEIFANAYEPRPHYVDLRVVRDHVLPPCRGVRAGSTQPCTLWRRQGQDGYW